MPCYAPVVNLVMWVRSGLYVGLAMRIPIGVARPIGNMERMDAVRESSVRICARRAVGLRE